VPGTTMEGSVNMLSEGGFWNGLIWSWQPATSFRICGHDGRAAGSLTGILSLVSFMELLCSLRQYFSHGNKLRVWTCGDCAFQRATVWVRS
jgi:hypothetical protein